MGFGYRCVCLEELMKRTVDVPSASGVYSIHWLKEGRYVSICRLAGVDSRGVLYIGSTKNLGRRIVDELAGSLKNFYSNHVTEFNHSFTYSLAYTGAKERIGPSELYICFKVFSTEEEAQYYEALALYEYSVRYGEPPPLNLNLRRGIIAILDLSRFNKTYLHEELNQDLKDMLGLQQKQ